MLDGSGLPLKTGLVYVHGVCYVFPDCVLIRGSVTFFGPLVLFCNRAVVENGDAEMGVRGDCA